MLEKPIITLTTDFGHKDPFVGIMKGVILEINPNAHIVDISHEITHHNIFEAAQTILMAYKYFPSTTIHVVVVDPQVGGARRPLLVVTEDHYFVGPDNGVFTPVLEEQHESSIFKVINIDSSHHYRAKKGSTFHGRDIFAPVAAWLSKGIESFKFGEQIDDYVKITLPKVKALDKTAFEGEVIHIDSFGNAITNISIDALNKLSPDFSKKDFKVIYKNQEVNLANYYSETDGSNLSVLINSFGYLELFIYRGNASEKFGVKIGDKVNVTAV